MAGQTGPTSNGSSATVVDHVSPFRSLVQIFDHVGHVVPKPQTTQIGFDVLKLEKPSSDLDSLLDCDLLPLEAISKNHTNSRESEHQILPHENEFSDLNPWSWMSAGVFWYCSSPLIEGNQFSSI